MTEVAAPIAQINEATAYIKGSIAEGTTTIDRLCFLLEPHEINELALKTGLSNHVIKAALETLLNEQRGNDTMI